VRLGLQQTEYTVYDIIDYLAVCAQVLSGNIAGKNIVVNYTTTTTDVIGIKEHLTSILCIMYTCIFPYRIKRIHYSEWLYTV